MNSQGENTRGSPQKAAPTRPLHGCACCFISALKRALTHMPFPIRPFFQTVHRWTHPLTHSLEHHCLCILAAVDDKVLAMGSVAEGCIFCTATQVKKVLLQLHTQGIVGTSACVWLKYEGIVKEDIQKAVCLANKIPLVKCVTPAVCAVSGPLAMAVLDWLSKQAGQQLEKGTDTQCVDNQNLVVAKQEVEMESPNTEAEAPRSIDATSTIDTAVGDVHSGGGEDVGVGDFVKHDKTDAGVDDFVEHSSGKDVSVDDEVLAKTSSVHGNIIEGDLQLADTSTLAEVNVDNSATAAGKTLERPFHSTPEGAVNVPDVLEMIESSWLRGHSSSNPPQRNVISRPRSDGFNKSLKTFFFG